MARLGLSQYPELFDYFVDVGGDALRFLLADEAAQRADNLSGAKYLRTGFAYGGTHFCRVWLRLGEQVIGRVREVRYRCERLIQLMGYAGRQFAHSRHTRNV